MNSRCLMLVPALAWMLSSCAADTEPDSPGSCSLSCSQPKVGASNFIVERLNAFDPPPIFCNADFATAGRDILPANGPIVVRYRVFEQVNLTLPAGAPSGEGGAGGEATGAAGATSILETVPKGGIGFEPLLFGSLAVEQTNPEHLLNPTTASPFKFAGVVTPKSEWCSDTCGNITYEFWPYCQAGGSTLVQAAVQVEGIPVEEAIEFTFGND